MMRWDAVWWIGDAWYDALRCRVMNGWCMVWCVEMPYDEWVMPCMMRWDAVWWVCGAWVTHWLVAWCVMWLVEKCCVMIKGMHECMNEWMNAWMSVCAVQNDCVQCVVNGNVFLLYFIFACIGNMSRSAPFQVFIYLWWINTNTQQENVCCVRTEPDFK